MCWQCAVSWGTWGRRLTTGRRRTGRVRRGRNRRCPTLPPRPGRPVSPGRIRTSTEEGFRCRLADYWLSWSRKRSLAIRRRTSFRAVRSSLQLIGWRNLIIRRRPKRKNIKKRGEIKRNEGSKAVVTVGLSLKNGDGDKRFNRWTSATWTDGRKKNRSMRNNNNTKKRVARASPFPHCARALLGLATTFTTQNSVNYSIRWLISCVSRPFHQTRLETTFGPHVRGFSQSN